MKEFTIQTIPEHEYLGYTLIKNLKNDKWDIWLGENKYIGCFDTYTLAKHYIDRIKAEGETE